MQDAVALRRIAFEISKRVVRGGVVVGDRDHSVSDTCVDERPNQLGEGPCAALGALAEIHETQKLVEVRVSHADCQFKQLRGVSKNRAARGQIVDLSKFACLGSARTIAPVSWGGPPAVKCTGFSGWAYESQDVCKTN